jgi:hypothetical protein
MKLGSFLSLLLLLTNVVFGNYVGNPQSPDLPKIISYTKDMTFAEQDYWLNAKLEYEKEYMQDMNLEFTSGGHGQRVQFSRFYGNYLTLTANILRRLDLYAKGGAVDPSFQYGAPTAFGTVSNALTNQKTIPAWALGAKLLLFKVNRFSFAVESSYFQTDHRNFLLLTATAPIAPVNTTVSWYNWQVSSAVSWNICPLVPYIGAKYSRTIVTLNQSTPALFIEPLKLDNRRKVGCFLGCTLLASRYLDLNFEGRFIDEQSFSGTLAYRF